MKTYLYWPNTKLLFSKVTCSAEYIHLKNVCHKLLSVLLWWYRASQKPEQFTMDADPSDGSPHQQQQPEPDSPWNRKAAPSRLPEPVLQQTAQPASWTWQHGDSQVRFNCLYEVLSDWMLSTCRFLKTIVIKDTTFIVFHLYKYCFHLK